MPCMRAAVVTVLPRDAENVGIAVAMEPAPGTLYVMAVVLAASFFVAGWRGVAGNA